MSIELTIKYSEAEYEAAVKEKLAVMPNKNIHTYLPTFILVIVVTALYYFNFIFSWWGIAIVVFLSFYAIPCLLGDFLVPSIALAFAKKKKQIPI